MSFFKGVSTQNSANPLNVTDLANVFGYILANPNGVVSSRPVSDPLSTNPLLSCPKVPCSAVHVLTHTP